MTTIQVGELSLSCTFGAGGDDGLEIVHDARDWLKEENWTLPICSKEITDPTNVKTSRQYMECKLAELYTATQEEFRYALQGIFIKPEETNQHKDTLDEKLSIAGEVYQHLQSTKTALERQSEDFWSIHVMLNLAVRKLVRIYSPSDLIRQIRVMALRLDEPFVSIDEGESFFLSGLEDEINACEQEASINEKIDELGKKIDSLANPIITLGQGGQHGHDKQEDFKHVLIKLRRMIKEGNRASLIVARCRELLYGANDTYLIAWYKHGSEISQQVPRIWK